MNISMALRSALAFLLLSSLALSALEVTVSPRVTKAKVGEEKIFYVTIFNNTQHFLEIYLQAIAPGLSARLSENMLTMPAGTQAIVNMYVSGDEAGTHELMIIVRALNANYYAKDTFTLVVEEPERRPKPGVSVDIKVPVGCVKVGKDEVERVNIEVTNVSNAEVDLRLEVRGGGVEAYFSSDIISSLAPNESVRRKLFIIPRSSGRKFLVIEAIYNANSTVVGRQVLCVDVAGEVMEEGIEVEATGIEKVIEGKFMGYEIKVKLKNNSDYAREVRLNFLGVQDAEILGDSTVVLAPWEEKESTYILIPKERKESVTLQVKTDGFVEYKHVPLSRLGATGLITLGSSFWLGLLMIALLGLISYKKGLFIRRRI